MSNRVPPPPLAILRPTDPVNAFPDAERALASPDGLLALGGDLSRVRLLYAYRHGIFPWYEEGQPILWWCPNPRLVLYPNEIHIGRRLRRWLKKTISSNRFEISIDQHFEPVIDRCAEPRAYNDDDQVHGDVNQRDQIGTWITPAMRNAYVELHHHGYAHSVEVFENEKLVGGIYGVAIGQVFFGESMFHRTTNASKLALIYLAQHLRAWGYQLIDCQVVSPHLTALGARTLPRSQFLRMLDKFCERPANTGAWRNTHAIQL
ncbi:MAG: leucyl/phenylalanyl-tRNA--protein transferase [Gammaproteobacteria bacterium]|nr:leucyl/phenylalanyl-tRNA--protein transferase [Gammaproteobacteria bacterium]